MTDDLQELEARLKRIEETTDKREVETKLAEEMKNYTGDDEVVSFRDIRDNPKVLKSLGTGLAPLDKLLSGGWQEGDLIVVTGPTGQGKTTLLQTFTISLSNQGVKSLWFSYEVTTQSLVQKFGNELPDGYVPKVLRENSIIWIERKIVESIVKFGVSAVFIDPFNSLTKFSSSRLSQELGDLSEQLKQIALKYNIMLFVSAHARRLNPDEIVYTEDSIRDTALLGNKANTILALWRNKLKQGKRDIESNGIVYTNESTISLTKNRNTGTLGFLKVTHQGNKFVLTEWEKSIEELEEQAIEENVITF
jgi:replicative DNA helicase